MFAPPIRPRLCPQRNLPVALNYSGDASTRLTAVQQALGLALSGQSYELDGRKVTRADIRALRQMEKELLIEVGQQAGGFTLGEFDVVISGDGNDT